MITLTLPDDLAGRAVRNAARQSRPVDRVGADLVTAAHIPSDPRQRRIWDMKVPV